MLFLKKIISRFQKKDGIFFAKMENLLGFRPKEIHYYEEAFTLGTALIRTKVTSRKCVPVW